jgi:hypothetical protein
MHQVDAIAMPQPVKRAGDEGRFRQSSEALARLVAHKFLTDSTRFIILGGLPLTNIAGSVDTHVQRNSAKHLGNHLVDFVAQVSMMVRHAIHEAEPIAHVFDWVQSRVGARHRLVVIVGM